MYCGIELEFKGNGVDEIGVISSIDYQKALNLNIDLSHLKIGQVVVKIDPRYFRPTEVDLLLGDPSQAQNELSWKREFSFPDLVDDMMKSDLNLMRKDQFLQNNGFKIMRYYE